MFVHNVKPDLECDPRSVQLLRGVSGNVVLDLGHRESRVGLHPVRDRMAEVDEHAPILVPPTQWRLSGMFDADHGAVLDAALAEMFDRLRQAGDRDVTKTDAPVAMANASLDAAPSPRRERFRINLFLDPTVSLRASWIDGYPIPDAIAALLTCDGTFIPTFIENALATSVGRATRVIPERTRRVVLRRDGGSSEWPGRTCLAPDPPGRPGCRPDARWPIVRRRS
ncbi:hypothetical protein BH24ACT5_BH24ACT5_10430 [soil metagenome]